MTVRITISLDDETGNLVQAMADKQIRSAASMAAALVTLQVRQMVQDGTITAEEVKAAKNK